MVRNKRILFLASLLQGYDTVIDIGSDHGYVLEEAFKRGYIKAGIATDVRKMPLERSMKTLENYPIKGILSDGFLAIDEMFDCAVIAGMGAHLIADIMAHAPLHDAVYIVQPNDKHASFRERINALGFKITDEFIIHDKFYYLVMILKRGTQNLSKEDLFLGPILKEKREAIPYYERRVHMFQNIMKTADEHRTQELMIEYQVLINHLSQLKSKE